MAQNYNIGNLGQKLTVDLAGNVTSLSTTVNAAAFSVGSSFIANSSQITIGAGVKLYANGNVGGQGQVLTSNGSTGSPYWSTVSGGSGSGSGTVTSVDTANGIGGGVITSTGTIYAIGNTGIVANSSGLHVNASYIGTISSNNASYLGGTAAASYQLNSTLNANIASYLPTYSGIVNASAFTTTGNANAANHYSGANALFSAASLLWTGNTTTSPTITLANTGNFVIGNSSTTQTTSTIVVANSTGNVQITPGTTSILATGIINSASHTVGSAFIANSTAIVGTGYANVTTSVNSALLTVGTNFIANSTAIVGTGYANVTTSVNSALLTVGTAFTANATLVNAAAINVVNQTNTATLYVTTSSNVASAVQSNSTGVWTTGTVNAATHSVGSGFVANTTVLNTNTDLSLTVNNKQLRFATVNALANVYFIQQNDDNFVFYSTNTVYGSRAVWSIYANSITSNLNFAVRTVFNSGMYIPTGVTLLDSTGSQGTAGQVLTSNGTGNVYWSTVSGAGGGGTGTVTSVATGNGMTGGTITTTGTVSVLANTGIVANATGTFVNATYIGTISSNNASYLGGTAAASYQLNSTLNANIASYLPTYTGVVNASAFTTTGNANAANHYSGANALFSAASIAWTGNTTTSPSITLANTGNFVIGNSSTTQTTSTITVANSTGNVQITPGTTSILATGIINAASHTTGGGYGSSGGGVTVNSTAVYVGNSTSNSYVNTTAMYTSGNGGLFAGASSNIVFNIGATNRMIIDSSGKVGIGTIPSSTLDVTGNGYFSSNVFTIGSSLYCSLSGNVGIGTTSPKAPLVITPSTYASSITPNKIRLFDDGANNYYAMGVSTSGGFDVISPGIISLSFNNPTTNTITNFAKFTNNQLVLSGTDGTAALLLAGATRAVRIFPSSSGTYIEGVDNTGVASYQSLILGGSQVSMTISNVEKFKVDSSGNVTMPSQPMCTVNHVATVTTYITGQPIQFTTSGGYDPRSMFSVVGGTYYRITVPVAGRYMIHANFLRDTASPGPLDLGLKKNGTQIYRMYNSNWAGYDDACMSAIVNCAASDYFDIINVSTAGSSTSVMIYGDSTYCGGQWSVYLIG